MPKKFILFFVISAIALISFIFVHKTSANVLPLGMRSMANIANPPGGQVASGGGTLLQRFREQIQTIKDERKKLLVEKIEDHIATSNARLTTKMKNALSRMSAILQDIKVKAAGQKAAGKDTTALDNAIAAAETAIANAQAAVNTQSQKEYTTTISDDTGLKGVIGQMVSQFKIDLTATYKTVVDARQAVANVIMELAKLGGIGNTFNASSSAITK